MQVEPAPKTSFARRLTARSAWIGPAWGFVCSALVTLIGGAAGFPYRHEASLAVFFVVFVLVSSYYNGRLKTQPAYVVGLAMVGAAVGAAIAHW